MFGKAILWCSLFNDTSEFKFDYLLQSILGTYLHFMLSKI